MNMIEALSFVAKKAESNVDLLARIVGNGILIGYDINRGWYYWPWAGYSGGAVYLPKPEHIQAQWEVVTMDYACQELERLEKEIIAKGKKVMEAEEKP